MAEPRRSLDPYVATWARIIRAIVERERIEEAERRRRMALVQGGKEVRAA